MHQRTDLPGASGFVDLDTGVRLHVRRAGPEDGDPVVLLHGFPEFWYGWHRQLDALADAGYRVLVPDQRGYNLSDKPDRVRDYRVAHLVDDVTALLDAEGHDRARVVGHDWGAMVAWLLALDHPERVERLGILNVPHPGVFGEFLLHSWRQRLKSWYTVAFQLPGVERVLGANDGALLERALTDSARAGTFSDADLARYRTAWGREGAVRGMVNWYRAAGRSPRLLRRNERVTVPTSVLWGARDVALERDMGAASAAMCDDGEVRYVENATHWLHHEEPGLVADHLLEFL